MADNAPEYGGNGDGGWDGGGGGDDTYDPGLDFGSYADPYQYVPIDSTLAGQADSGNVGEDSGDVGYGSGDVGDTPDPNSYGGVRQGDDPSADNYDPALDPSYGDNSSQQSSNFRQGDDPSGIGYDPALDPNYGAPSSNGKSGGFWNTVGNAIFGKSGGSASGSASNGVPAIAGGNSKPNGTQGSSATDAVTNALMKLAALEKAIVGSVAATRQAVTGTGGNQAGVPVVKKTTSGTNTATLVIVASIASIVGLVLLFADRKK